MLVIEREQFPRFSIGESLLPQSMAYIEEAGMLQAIDAEAKRRGLTRTAFLASAARKEIEAA